MIIELHSLLTHDYFSIYNSKTGNWTKFDTRKITNASRRRLWTIIDSSTVIGRDTWLARIGR